LGLKGPKSPKKRLDALEEKGYIRRRRGKSRAIEVMGISLSRSYRLVPLVGKVRAGTPSLAFEEFEGEIALDRSLTGDDETFFLRVRGDSMIGDHIRDGDLALVHPQSVVENGEIAVVLMDDEATLTAPALQSGRGTHYREERRKEGNHRGQNHRNIQEGDVNGDHPCWGH
jgi:repressor LexA